ncbi:hypothetical protein SAMN05216228_101344 [Rhizobium tibeticum]|uniref:Uncharacterized protein n=1 Tax=Rhizobium tibeticum TaxID=501024 RepID=A0A1H8MT49_9HYPH|nr:hypothetical protein RTCCBAU85039_4696 [Rhizobium tibeticum]SEO20420.1 hypothetical protein SAMN05216228_101344 [Rhizobium tibeticum]
MTSQDRIVAAPHQKSAQERRRCLSPCASVVYGSGSLSLMTIRRGVAMADPKKPAIGGSPLDDLRQGKLTKSLRLLSRISISREARSEIVNALALEFQPQSYLRVMPVA